MRADQRREALSEGLLWASLWALFVGVALLTRPLLPVDETRYLSVAWEMWRRGDFLVPYLNGDPYSDKPPLLFWLMHAGWWLFGVNEWWPRLIGPLFGALALILTARLGGRLWSDLRPLPSRAAGLLAGTILWLLFLTVVQFDLLLVVATLLGMLGLLRAARAEGAFWRAWAGVGLALGLGGLAKGPVILLHVLPAALLAPWWLRGASHPAWPRWYAGIAFAVVLGVGATLAWALPAAQAGGEAYRNAILWGQTAGRLRDSFAHAEPWWWYLAVLPPALLPWVAWPRLWRSARACGCLGESAGRFLIAWAVPVLILFSLVSGKQVKYLLPIVPALAIMAARWLVGAPGFEGRERLVVPGLGLLTLGLVIATVGWVPAAKAPAWLSAVHPAWGLLLVLLGALALRLPPQPSRRLVPAITLAATVGVGGLHLALAEAVGQAYDLSEVARRVAAYQAEGRPVLNVGKYHGQYQFLGRLTHPLEEADSDAALAWAKQHPDGYLILYQSGRKPVPPGAEYSQAYRGDRVSLWRSSVFLERQSAR